MFLVLAQFYLKFKFKVENYQNRFCECEGYESEKCYHQG